MKDLPTLVLMEIAAELGLPIEAINQAGAYVLLKLSRLTETDLDDCQRMLEYAWDHGEAVDRSRLEAAIR